MLRVMLLRPPTSDDDDIQKDTETSTGELVDGATRRRTVPTVRDSEEDETESSDDEDDASKARQLLSWSWLPHKRKLRTPSVKWQRFAPGSRRPP